MTQLKDKIQDAMDESRMLVLGAEILIGFEFAAIFQDGFKKLSTRSQNLNVIALTLMLFTLVLLLSPSAFHQLAESGEDSIRLHRFATRVMEVALLPFALGLGARTYTFQQRKSMERPPALLLVWRLLFWHASSGTGRCYCGALARVNESQAIR
jgi:hypothetical protein